MAGDTQLKRKWYSLEVISSVLLIISGIVFLYAVYTLIMYKPPRGDEGLSFIECSNTSLIDLLYSIKHGADNSYIHSIILWLVFELFGPSLLVQRFVSFLIFSSAIWLLYDLLHRFFSKRLSLFGTATVAFANICYFLASDGRFYSLLMLISVIFARQVIRLTGRSFFSYSASIFLLTLTGFLTSINFGLIVLLSLSTLILLVIFNRVQRFYLKGLFPYLAGVIPAVILYLTVFRIGFFTDIQTKSFTHRHAEPIVKAFRGLAENFFRWIAIPEFAWGRMTLNICILLGIIVVLVVVYFQRIRAFWKSCKIHERISILMGALVAKTVLWKGVLASILPFYLVWEYRYYSPIFFTVAFLLVAIIKPIPVIIQRVVMLLLSTGYLLSTIYYADKYSDKKESFASLYKYTTYAPSQKYVFIETDSDSVFHAFIRAYYQYPFSRKNLYLVSKTSEPTRVEHFKKLAELNNQFNFSTSLPDMNAQIISSMPIPGCKSIKLAGNIFLSECEGKQ